MAGPPLWVSLSPVFSSNERVCPARRGLLCAFRTRAGWSSHPKHRYVWCQPSLPCPRQRSRLFSLSLCGPRGGVRGQGWTCSSLRPSSTFLGLRFRLPWRLSHGTPSSRLHQPSLRAGHRRSLPFGRRFEGHSMSCRWLAQITPVGVTPAAQGRVPVCSSRCPSALTLTAK